MKSLPINHSSAINLLIACLLLQALSLLTMNCSKDDIPVPEGEIVQPLQANDPAILPEPVIVIKKLEGAFTPLLTSVLADWRIKSHKQFADGGCWSDWVNTYYYGVTREGITGKSVSYPSCGIHPGGSWVVDFSAPAISIWAQYKKGQEIQDGDLHQSTGKTVNFYRYYTIPDFPQAYIQMERRWEVVKIEGSDYAHCQGCSSLEKTTRTTTGLKEEETKTWGYTLGFEWGGTAGIGFVEASTKFSATVMQQFSTSVTKTKEQTEEIKCIGTLPAGKSTIRLQAFREYLTFRLVNANGTAYGKGVFCPVIETTNQIKNYAWYY